jgi:hypothetical protein
MRARLDRLDAIARRAEFLLRRSPDPQAEMRWAERRLEEQDLWHGSPPSNRGDLAAWAQAVIASNPDLVDSLFYLEWRDSHPDRAETFENLVLSMIPSEGGL